MRSGSAPPDSRFRNRLLDNSGDPDQCLAIQFPLVDQGCLDYTRGNIEMGGGFHDIVIIRLGGLDLLQQGAEGTEELLGERALKLLTRSFGAGRRNEAAPVGMKKVED